MTAPIAPAFIPIPDDTSWTDETAGGTWTAHGDGLRLDDDSIQSVRQDLIAFLEAAHPTWNWYDYPPDQVSTPAMVLNPDDPYIEPATSGGGPGVQIWAFELVMVVGRGSPEDGLRRLEFFHEEITETLNGFPSARWTTFGQIGTTQVGGIEHLTGVLGIAVMQQKGQTI